MGYYKCIRCGGGDVYTSEENGRTFAVTLDTPSAVDPTLFHTMKQTTSRCRNCGEKSQYVVDEYDIRSSAKFQIILGWVLGSVLLVIGGVTFFLYGFTSSFSDFTVLIGIGASVVNILMGRAKLKKLDSETP
jgi:DNA-directed RNA polymerase subunit RPC12/RpoP